MVTKIGGDIIGDYFNSPISLRGDYTNRGVVLGRYLGGSFSPLTAYLYGTHNQLYSFYVGLSNNEVANNDFVEVTNYYVKAKRQGVYTFHIVVPISNQTADRVTLYVSIAGTSYSLDSKDMPVQDVNSNEFSTLVGSGTVELAENQTIHFHIQSSNNSALSVPSFAYSNFTINYQGWFSGGVDNIDTDGTTPAIPPKLELNTDNFDKILESKPKTVQEALEILDDHTHESTTVIENIIVSSTISAGGVGLSERYIFSDMNITKVAFRTNTGSCDIDLLVNGVIKESFNVSDSFTKQDVDIPVTAGNEISLSCTSSSSAEGLIFQIFMS